MTQASKRINFFIFIIFLIFILIGVRLFYLQIVHGRDYRREAEDQYFYTTGDNFDRGAINFTNKDGSPAVAVQMTNEYDIDIDPKTISADLSSKINSSQSESELQREIYNKLLSAFEKNKPKENIATTSTSTTGVLVDENTFFNKINKKNSSFEILATNVNEYIANDILGLKLKGVIVNRKKSRVYFSKDTGAKVLGFVGYSGNERVGLYGVEKYYNDVLMKSSTVKSNFFAEIFSDFNSTQNAVTDDDEDCSVQKAVIAFEQGAKAQWAGQGVRQIYPFSSEEEGSSLINEIPDNVRTDYLRGAWEALHLALTHLPLDKRQEDTLEQAKIMKEKMQARFGEMPAFEHVLYIAPNEQEMNKRWAEEEIKFNEKIEALKKST
jgi:hypothetical protein